MHAGRRACWAACHPQGCSSTGCQTVPVATGNGQGRCCVCAAAEGPPPACCRGLRCGGWRCEGSHRREPSLSFLQLSAPPFSDPPAHSAPSFSLSFSRSVCACMYGAPSISFVLSDPLRGSLSVATWRISAARAGHPAPRRCERAWTGGWRASARPRRGLRRAAQYPSTGSRSARKSPSVHSVGRQLVDR